LTAAAPAAATAIHVQQGRIELLSALTVRPHRISRDQPLSVFDRLTAQPLPRYASAAVAVVVISVGCLLLGSWLGMELGFLVLFGGIVLTSAMAGLGPGLLATGLTVVATLWILPRRPTGWELARLAVSGALVSVVGGTLRAARRRAREQLAETLRLEQQILEIGDDERRRIGHDLHDGLGQHLTGISLLSETMAQQIESGAQPDPASVETITRLVSEAVGITRDLAKTLSPVTLERDGFLAAVEELADMSSSLLGVHCAYEYDGDENLELDRTRSLHLYRIIQEAVNNSVRHGKATNVRVRVQHDRGKLRATVVDDGCGLSQKTAVNPGLGLRIMEYRARMLSASLTVERANAAGGTIVVCTCPLDGHDDAT
jgi:signal transduction histidine kinase